MGNFIDLCRGPHAQDTKQIGALKLIETSGVYYRGDESNEQLQRIYGTAFASKEELQQYEERLEQARARERAGAGAAHVRFLAGAAETAEFDPPFASETV